MPVAQLAPRIDLDDDFESRPKRAGRWAWGICWLMFASTALNYMDRQAVAVASAGRSGQYPGHGTGK